MPIQTIEFTLNTRHHRWLVAGPTFLVVVGGYTASLLSDRLSRKLVMQIGVIISTLFTLLIPLAQSAEQLVVIRLITGIGMGFCHPGGLSDRCRADAGAASAHLWRDL